MKYIKHFEQLNNLSNMDKYIIRIDKSSYDNRLGEFVIDIKKYCKDNKIKFKTNKKIDQLSADYNLEDLYYVDGNNNDEEDIKLNSQIVKIHDLIFHQNFINADGVGYKKDNSIDDYPILICNYKNNLYVLDGYHRVFRNLSKNIDTINGYIVYYDDIENDED